MTAFTRVKELAKIRKLSLREVNDKAGLGKNSIYKWKTSAPSIENASKVAKVLNTSADYLMGKTDNPTIPNNSENHINSNTLTWLDLDMPYGGSVPDELKDYYKAMAEQYIKQHPEILKKRDEK